MLTDAHRQHIMTSINELGQQMLFINLFMQSQNIL